jgi:hypothetical protein
MPPRRTPYNPQCERYPPSPLRELRRGRRLLQERQVRFEVFQSHLFDRNEMEGG